MTCRKDSGQKTSIKYDYQYLTVDQGHIIAFIVQMTIDSSIFMLACPKLNNAMMLYILNCILL